MQKFETREELAAWAGALARNAGTDRLEQLKVVTQVRAATSLNKHLFEENK
jgi:hypothetical protein